MSPVPPRTEGKTPACVPEGMEDVYAEFLTEAGEILDRIDAAVVELERDAAAPGTLDAVFRGMHTIKGAAGFLNLDDVQGEAHAAETLLARMREQGLDAGDLDSVLGHVDRLRIALGQKATIAPTVRVDGATLDRLLELSADLAARSVHGASRTAHELRRTVLAARVQPLGEVFARLPRVIRDLGNMLGKQVDLEIRGKEVEVDRAFLDVLGEMLVHLLRNAVDHGVETAEERAAAGKRRSGRVVVSARPVVDGVLIEVSDDGRGVDVARVRAIAVQRGLLDERSARGLSEKESIELLFRPGFSTAGTAGMFSGRGVGMDAVRAAAEEVGGHVTMDSVSGKGTTVRVHLPSTLLGMPVLVFTVADVRCALPRTVLVRAVPAAEIVDVAGSPAYAHGSTLVPVVPLGEVCGVPDAACDVGLLCRVADRDVVFGVSAVVGTEEMLVKRPDPLLRSAGVYAGTGTVGEDVVLLLDPAGLLRRSGVSAPASHGDADRPHDPRVTNPYGILVSSGPGLYVLAESSVMRVVPASHAAPVSARPGFVVLGDSVLRLVRPDGAPPTGRGVLVVGTDDEAFEVDVVHERVAIPSDTSSGTSSGAPRFVPTSRGPALRVAPSSCAGAS